MREYTQQLEIFLHGDGAGEVSLGGGLFQSKYRVQTAVLQTI